MEIISLTRYRIISSLSMTILLTVFDQSCQINAIPINIIYNK